MKKLLVSTLAVGFIMTGVLGAGAYAQAPAPSSNKLFYSSLVDKIAAVFGLDKAKVQTVVDDWHKEHMTMRVERMHQKLGDRLNQAVEDGRITNEQRTAIMDKLREHKVSLNKNELKEMTPEKRRAALETRRAELEEWARSQGIDPEVLIEYGVGKMKVMMHRGR